jgi:DNA-binding HxlR family transcriptional regulator
MRSYREYCPIARSSEILAERWTPLVIRNLLHGCHTFTEIARGVPAMSRSLLIKRLRELERSGVVVRAGDGTYQLTEAGADLAEVIEAMETWGQRWLPVTTEHSDPSFVLWAWTRFYLDPGTLPEDRVLVEFTFPDERPTNRRYWILAERGSAELCYSDPGGEPDLYVTARSVPFTQWHVGSLGWHRALADGSIAVSGPPELARAMPTWNRHPEMAST